MFTACPEGYDFTNVGFLDFSNADYYDYFYDYQEGDHINTYSRPCYALEQTELDFDAADSNCNSNGGQLMEPTSDYTLKTLLSVFIEKLISISSDGYWIGIKNVEGV